MYNFILGDIQFPVAPPSLEVAIQGKNETVTLINEGEVNLIKKPGLTELTFELLLPNQEYPFAEYYNGFQPSTYYLAYLERVMIEQKPVTFIVNRFLPDGRLLFDTNIQVSLESYTILEDAEDLGFDVRVQLNLKQYRAFGTKRVTTQTTTPTTNTSTGATTNTTGVTTNTNRSTVGRTIPKQHKVVRGETLWGIAKKYFGNGAMYTELVRLNPTITNAALIREGQVINLR